MLAVFEQLSHSIAALTRSVWALSDSDCPNQQTKAILNRLAQLEKNLMATQAELAADIRAVTVQLAKSAEETKELQASVNVLKDRITELEESLGDNVSQEVLDAVTALKAQAQIVDDNIPDVVKAPAERR